MNQDVIRPAKETEIARRMAELGVRESDLEETFVRSGGHGGQNVNKVSTCVLLRHRPSGLLVKCQTSRQQGTNRWLARQLLLDKLAAARRKTAAAERDRREKRRRQQRQPNARAQARRLADKSRQSARKTARQRVGED